MKKKTFKTLSIGISWYFLITFAGSNLFFIENESHETVLFYFGVFNLCVEDIIKYGAKNFLSLLITSGHVNLVNKPV